MFSVLSFFCMKGLQAFPILSIELMRFHCTYGTLHQQEGVSSSVGFVMIIDRAGEVTEIPHIPEDAVICG